MTLELEQEQPQPTVVVVVKLPPRRGESEGCDTCGAAGGPEPGWYWNQVLRFLAPPVDGQWAPQVLTHIDVCGECGAPA